MAQRMPEPSHWEELEDFENMINEFEIEPDYFIDMEPSAIYIPIPKGKDKTTQVQDRIDPELFNFDQEVEPILQVLVGKSLELARIEVLEDDERVEREKSLLIYKQKREAELI
jgi:hypothetical protein